MTPTTTTTTTFSPSELFAELSAATPAARLQIIQKLIAQHPQRRLALPADGATGANLTSVDFTSIASLREANLQGANLSKANLSHLDLRKANLQNAYLGEANLASAQLEEADLTGADLVAANLRGAALGEAQLHGALLEDADLQDASLRFANLSEAVLEKANLQRADLWGALLARAVLAHAQLQAVTLKEANLQHADLRGANLQGADLTNADLTGANLSGANLQGAQLSGANLENAILTDARLQDVALTHCNLRHVHLSRAWLDRTRLRQQQLGDALGEEIVAAYEEARMGYLALERNFAALGDPDAASWAYRRKRRMQKLAALQSARRAWAQGQFAAALSGLLHYASDQFTEWLCDYGESIPRVLGSIVVMNIVFMLIYALTGSVERVTETPQGPVRAVTHNLIDLVIFSITAMSTSGLPAFGIVPRTEYVYFLTGTQAILGIALTGLLGFVAGNRIRR